MFRISVERAVVFTVRWGQVPHSAVLFRGTECTFSILTVRVRSRTHKNAMRKHDKPLTPRQIAAARDQDIDFSDIPELDDEFWRNAELVEPDRTEEVTQSHSSNS